MNYIDKYEKNEIMLVGKAQMSRIYDIFLTWGAPMPDGYIENDYFGKAGSYVQLDEWFDVSNKKFLSNVREYMPKTYFEGEMVEVKDIKYYAKNLALDNGEGIKIFNFSGMKDTIETFKVPKGHLVQEEVEPLLLDGHKFDLRVLICVSRDGSVFLSENILYKLSREKYDAESTDFKDNITNTCLSEKNFFYDDKDRHLGLDMTELHSNFVQQLRVIIPSIYQKVLSISNKLDKLPEDGLNQYYYIHGLDFIPDKNGRLHFLELNSPPGHAGECGIHNYHNFFENVTKFIVNNKTFENVWKKY